MTSVFSRFTWFVLALSLAACATDADKTGEVSTPVETVGGDGATYHLPQSTRLSLGSIGSIANYDVGLDGDSSVVSVRVAEGSYQAGIYNTDHDYTTDWPLVRTAPDGTTSTVIATLITPQPVAMNVVADQTTSLMFQFSIASGGTITFGHGTVAIAIGVGLQPATSFTASMHGSGDVLGTPNVTGPYANALTQALPSAGATGLAISVDVRLTGSWQEAGGSIDSDGISLAVCAPIALMASSASGNTGFADVIAETGHGNAPDFLFGPASLCITDFGDVEEVRIRISREGVAETGTFTTMLGTQPALFWNVLRGTLPTRVYDSQNGILNLDALAGIAALPMRLVTRVGADPSDLWFGETVTGTMTFSFVGHS